HGDVLTSASPTGQVHGAIETLPPLFFHRSTPLTANCDAIQGFADQVCSGTQDALDRAGMLNRALFDRVTLKPGRSPKSRTAAQTLAEGWGNVRDCVQLLVASARAAGLAARFVSGHCLDSPHASDHKSAHCWAEIHSEGHGWVGFDPALGRPPGEMHVRVAIGLDARDATPLSGTRTGGGIEEMDVEVHIDHDGSQ
ncbi:MAG: hypothetical protein RL367_2148, partial [Pseudomonadota bacterium]